MNENIIRSLDRQRATWRRVILGSFIVAALLAWALVGFGFFLAWLMR
jgi:uncharacterized BrkB/YihY/UPF0761 family membrane protein